MKTTAFALITLVVGSIASPTLPDIFYTGITPEAQSGRSVEGQVIDAVNAFAQQIRDAGLDPYTRDWSAVYALPIPTIFSANAIVDNLQFYGLSNMLFEDLNFSLWQRRLTFHVYIPTVTTTVDDVKANAVVLGEELSAALSGSVTINYIRFIADVHFNIRILGETTVRSILINFFVSGMESKLDVNVFGKDISSEINTLLEDIPHSLYAIRGEIDRFLVGVAWSIVNGQRGAVF